MKKVKFGGTPKEQDYLADLVVRNIKTATSSLLELQSKTSYTQKGDCWTITDSSEIPVCNVQVYKVSIKKFSEINASFALKEGDGDLENWTKIHKNYYSYLLEKKDKQLTTSTLLECVFFKKIS